jgi:hypothetical protein
MHRAYLSAVCAAALLAGCGGSQAAPSTTGVGAASRDSFGNIYWNKHRVDLHSPPATHATATLTYWAPDGYETVGPSCKHGGTIAATTHRSWGDPSGYMHVVYWFKAKTAGPDACGFSAILQNTGSPPIAPIKLHIDAP